MTTSQRVEGRITCGTCYEISTSPVRMSCGHLFCARCLDRDDDECRLCGTARGEIIGMDMKAAEIMRDLPPAEAQTTQRSPTVCDWCETVKPEVACVDCKTSLCRGCAQTLHCKRNMASHQLIALTAVLTKTLYRPSRCGVPGHDRAVFKYYCKSCEQIGCSYCVAENHRGHDGIVTVNDVKPEILSNLEKQHKTVSDAKQRLKDLAAGNIQTRVQMRNTGRNFEEHVKIVFETLRHDLDKEEASILAKYKSSKKQASACIAKSTEEVLTQLDISNRNLRSIENRISKAGNGDVAAAILSEETSCPAPCLVGLTVPRGPGIQFDLAEIKHPRLAEEFNFSLSLSDLPGGCYQNLTFARSSLSSISVASHLDGSTTLRNGKLSGWASIKSLKTFTESDTCQWKVVLHSFDTMIGVASASETRHDLHQGNSFFWYTDIQNPSFGQLGCSTPALESLPPLTAVSAGSPVAVVFKYNGGEATLSVTVNGVDKGVIGTNITPPVSPAFSFVGEDQCVVVHS